MAKGGAVDRATAITASDSTVYESGELVIINRTVAGNVGVRLASGGTHTIAAAVGYAAYPYRVIGVNSTSLTATATYANMHSS